jgi:hypothetical protein
MGAHPEIRKKQMTTREVVERIIQPAITPKVQRYADRLKLPMKGSSSGGKELVSDGHPFFYVVHVWSCPFVEMVDQLITYTIRNGLKANETFVWIDIFAINQTKPSLSGMSDDSIPLVEEVIMDAQETLVVIDKRGLILQRMWCLWEVWTTLQVKAQGKAAIIPLRYGLKMEPLKPLVNALDVKSKAIATSVESDKARLMMSIDRAFGGAQSMNLDMKGLFLLLKDTDPVAQEPLVNYATINKEDIEI